MFAIRRRKNESCFYDLLNVKKYENKKYEKNYILKLQRKCMNHCEREIINVQIKMCCIKLIINVLPSDINDKQCLKVIYQIMYNYMSHVTH